MTDQTVNLTTTQQRLLAAAREASSRRAAEAVYGTRDTVLRQSMLALLAGAELAAHDSPPEATLQVLAGRVRLIAGDRSWALITGDLKAIPHERHSVIALDDSVFLLTVLRATTEGTRHE